MAELGRIGLIVNPAAGRDPRTTQARAREALQRLAPTIVVTGTIERPVLASGQAGEIEVAEVSETALGSQRTAALTDALIASGVEALVVVGGDGTLADVAEVIVQRNADTPVIGIGVGSTNAGPLISVRADEIRTLDPAALRSHAIDAFAVTLGDASLGVACHDVTVGATVVSSIDGVPCDVDAAALSRGARRPARPRSVARRGARVSVRHADREPLVVGRDEAVGAVVLGFTRSAFFAQAVTGGICLATLTGLPAGCLVSDRPLVRIDVTSSELLAEPPLTTRFVSLAFGSVVSITGFGGGAAMVLDGNPRRLLQPEDVVEVRICHAAVRVLRPGVGP